MRLGSKGWVREEVNMPSGLEIHYSLEYFLPCGSYVQLDIWRDKDIYEVFIGTDETIQTGDIGDAELFYFEGAARTIKEAKELAAREFNKRLKKYKEQVFKLREL